MDAASPASAAPACAVPVRFADVVRFRLKPGFIGFGGPAGQIALLHEKLADRRRWISERRLPHS